MKTIFLVKNGKANSSFEIRETSIPVPKANQVLIKSEAFGLNFADVMARLGIYRDAPPIPSVLGYEVVGRIENFGSEVKNFKKGERVVAFTRFGAYAQYAVTDYRAAVSIPENMDAGIATALATQYCTAWFCAEEMINLREGNNVLINAAAGGVGIALIQLAKRKDCTVYANCGSDEKLSFLKNLGADFVFNYNKQDYFIELKEKKIRIDVVFDSLGGKNFKKGYKLLTHGGRIVGYGAAEQVHSKKLFSSLSLLFGFGFYSPAFMLMQSKSIIGANMLRIADSKPDVLQRCLQNVVELAINGDIKPHVGATFSADKIADAHQFLESRKSIGKIVVKW